MRAFGFVAAFAAVVAAAFAAWYRVEDPFLRRWPSPRERARAARLVALHDLYETESWSR